MPTIRSRILKRQRQPVPQGGSRGLNANDPFEDTETVVGVKCAVEWHSAYLKMSSVTTGIAITIAVAQYITSGGTSPTFLSNPILFNGGGHPPVSRRE